jgi:hypothetical protein
MDDPDTYNLRKDGFREFVQAVCYGLLCAGTVLSLKLFRNVLKESEGDPTTCV